jgi:hypothetical protein
MESHFNDIKLKFEKYTDLYPNITSLWIVYSEEMLKQYKQFNASVEHSLSILETGAVNDLSIDTIATLYTIGKQPNTNRIDNSEDDEDSEDSENSKDNKK